MTSYNVFNYQAWVPCGEIFFTRFFNVLFSIIAGDSVFLLPYFFQTTNTHHA